MPPKKTADPVPDAEAAADAEARKAAQAAAAKDAEAKKAEEAALAKQQQELAERQRRQKEADDRQRLQQQQQQRQQQSSQPDQPSTLNGFSAEQTKELKDKNPGAYEALLRQQRVYEAELAKAKQQATAVAAAAATAAGTSSQGASVGAQRSRDHDGDVQMLEALAENMGTLANSVTGIVSKLDDTLGHSSAAFKSFETTESRKRVTGTRARITADISAEQLADAFTHSGIDEVEIPALILERLHILKKSVPLVFFSDEKLAEALDPKSTTYATLKSAQIHVDNKVDQSLTDHGRYRELANRWIKAMTHKLYYHVKSGDPEDRREEDRQTEYALFLEHIVVVADKLERARTPLAKLALINYDILIRHIAFTIDVFNPAIWHEAAFQQSFQDANAQLLKEATDVANAKAKELEEKFIKFRLSTSGSSSSGSWKKSKSNHQGFERDDSGEGSSHGGGGGNTRKNSNSHGTSPYARKSSFRGDGDEAPSTTKTCWACGDVHGAGWDKCTKPNGLEKISNGKGWRHTETGKTICMQFQRLARDGSSCKRSNCKDYHHCLACGDGSHGAEAHYST